MPNAYLAVVGIALFYLISSLRHRKSGNDTDVLK